jgi:hypothetical protein
VSDAEGKLKKKILSELQELSLIGEKGNVFTVTIREANNLQKQNNAARAACKYPGLVV